MMRINPGGQILGEHNISSTCFADAGDLYDCLRPSSISNPHSVQRTRCNGAEYRLGSVGSVNMPATATTYNSTLDRVLAVVDRYLCTHIFLQSKLTRAKIPVLYRRLTFRRRSEYSLRIYFVTFVHTVRTVPLPTYYKRSNYSMRRRQSHEMTVTRTCSKHSIRI